MCRYNYDNVSPTIFDIFDHLCISRLSYLYHIIKIVLKLTFYLIYNTYTIPISPSLSLSLYLPQDYYYKYTRSQRLTKYLQYCIYINVSMLSILYTMNHPWYSGSAMDCWPTGRAIDPAPGAWFTTNFISFAQVFPGLAYLQCRIVA